MNKLVFLMTAFISVGTANAYECKAVSGLSGQICAEISNGTEGSVVLSDVYANLALSDGNHDIRFRATQALASDVCQLYVGPRFRATSAIKKKMNGVDQIGDPHALSGNLIGRLLPDSTGSKVWAYAGEGFSDGDRVKNRLVSITCSETNSLRLNAVARFFWGP